MDILTPILNHPATGYFIGFGALGVLVTLALNSAHKRFDLSERVWGLLTLGVGAVGGILIQEVGLVTLSGGHGVVSHLLAAFVGASTSMAACGFSQIDLRSVVSNKPKSNG